MQTDNTTFLMRPQARAANAAGTATRASDLSKGRIRKVACARQAEGTAKRLDGHLLGPRVLLGAVFVRGPALLGWRRDPEQSTGKLLQLVLPADGREITPAIWRGLVAAERAGQRGDASAVKVDGL